MRTARPQPGGFAAKARDLQALRDAVDQAATVSGALWISYIFVFLYLAIAASAVTHRDLFFENPVRLPFLGVELPLTAFFVLGPLLFLIVHAYTLLHFALLAGKVGAFQTELEAAVPLHSSREDLRRQLPSNIFVQFLAGPRGVRSGVFGFMLRLIAWISLMIGPVALLVFFELQFLPYHNPEVTWWHRSAVVIDLVLLWILWPRAAPITATGRLRRYPCIVLRSVGLTGLSLLSLLLVGVATFQGERLHGKVLSGLRFVPASFAEIGEDWWDKILRGHFYDIRWPNEKKRLTLHEFLVGGEVDDIAQRQKSWWSNRLVVPGIDVRELPKFDTEAKVESRPTTLSLRKRRLEDAVLSGAYLPKVDFTGARLENALLLDASLSKANFSGAFLKEAKLIRSDLRWAKFDCIDPGRGAGKQCANLDGASLNEANLQYASLNYAQLQGAWLNQAKLEGASLIKAELQGASLNHAQFQGATLNSAGLQRVSLYGANLKGAKLNKADLQGAWLTGAELQGASLNNAQLQGVSLFNLNLQGASLNEARLRGASLDHAHLQGASLRRAELHGASLRGTQLQGAELYVAQFKGAFLDRTEIQGAMLVQAKLEVALLRDILGWRADAMFVETQGAYISPVITEPKYRDALNHNGGSGCAQIEPCDWLPESYAELKRLIEKMVPAGEERKSSLVRIARLDPRKTQKWEPKQWSKIETNQSTREDYLKRLADVLQDIGCHSDGAPYVVAGLANDLEARFYKYGKGSRVQDAYERREAGRIATAFLNEEDCHGARGLSEKDRTLLREIQARAPRNPAVTAPPAKVSD